VYFAANVLIPDLSSSVQIKIL